jgi:hypothetical protein
MTAESTVIKGWGGKLVSLESILHENSCSHRTFSSGARQRS